MSRAAKRCICENLCLVLIIWYHNGKIQLLSLLILAIHNIVVVVISKQQSSYNIAQRSQQFELDTTEISITINNAQIHHTRTSQRCEHSYHSCMLLPAHSQIPIVHVTSHLRIILMPNVAQTDHLVLTATATSPIVELEVIGVSLCMTSRCPNLTSIHP
jgi:hypothetical protein